MGNVSRNSNFNVEVNSFTFNDGETSKTVTFSAGFGSDPFVTLGQQGTTPTMVTITAISKISMTVQRLNDGGELTVNYKAMTRD